MNRRSDFFVAMLLKTKHVKRTGIPSVVTRLILDLGETRARNWLDNRVLPGFLTRRRIENARWTGELTTVFEIMPSKPPVPESLRYVADLSVTPNLDGVELQVAIYPRTPPGKRVRPAVYEPFVQRHGLIRYGQAPSWLAYLDRDARRSLGAARCTYKSHRSPGPWEYLPSDGFVDWRVRAREVIKCQPEPAALVDLIRGISLAPLLYVRSARLTVNYHRF